MEFLQIKIMLGGFSQGGASAMYVGYTYPKKLAGFIFLSSYLPQQDEFLKRVNLGISNQATEFLMCHGEADEMVTFQWGKRSCDQLLTLGMKGTFKAFPEMGHEATNEEIGDVLSFILRIFTNSKL